MDQWDAIVFSFIGLMGISFGITWFLGFYLRLNYTTLFIVFSLLLFFQRILINYFLPFQVIQEFVETLNILQIFGFVLFGISSGFVNTWILYYRFGFLGSFALAFGATLVGNGLVDAYLFGKRQASQAIANIQKV
jgi:hypothetical protein